MKKFFWTLRGERGEVNLGSILLLAICMIFLAVGFIFLPISTTATQSLLDYAYSGNVAITDVTFTGFTSVVGITPLLILVGFIVAGVITGMLNIKVMKSGGSAKATPGTLILLGLSIVFIAVGLIVEPITLDGIASVLHNGGAGVSASFTGYESILLMSPLLVHLSFILGAVMVGFFGLKNLASSTNED